MREEVSLNAQTGQSQCATKSILIQQNDCIQQSQVWWPTKSNSAPYKVQNQSVEKVDECANKLNALVKKSNSMRQEVEFKELIARHAKKSN